MLNILIYDGVCGVVRVTLDNLDVQEIKDTAELARSYAAKRGDWHVRFTKVLGRDKFACLDDYQDTISIMTDGITWTIYVFDLSGNPFALSLLDEGLIISTKVEVEFRSGGYTRREVRKLCSPELYDEVERICLFEETN